MFWEYDPFLVEVLLEKDLVVTIFLSESFEADEPEDTGLTRGDGVDRRGAGSFCFGIALRRGMITEQQQRQYDKQ